MMGLFAVQPLFDCVDRIVATSEEENIGVTCRIVSMKTELDDVSVRVFVGDEKNFTISVNLGAGLTEQAYPDDQRYVLSVIAIPRVRILLSLLLLLFRKECST